MDSRRKAVLECGRRSSKQPNCPICSEAFQADDANFQPCPCGYRVCSFCWHRIRTSEDGQCPACCEIYPETPAKYKPLTKKQINQFNNDRQKRENKRKEEVSEFRRQLANIRNLSPRLADPKILKRKDMFGKFGTIEKVAINSKGKSPSAYITYARAQNALHAVSEANNAIIDGAMLTVSLGTMKYCPKCIEGSRCAKQDCTYLHVLGDELARLTIDEIKQGKKLHYEQRLQEQYRASKTSQSASSSSSSSSSASSLQPSTSSSPTQTSSSLSPPISSSSSSFSSSSSPTTTYLETPTEDANIDFDPVQVALNGLNQLLLFKGFIPEWRKATRTNRTCGMPSTNGNDEELSPLEEELKELDRFQLFPELSPLEEELKELDRLQLHDSVVEFARQYPSELMANCEECGLNLPMLRYGLFSS